MNTTNGVGDVCTLDAPGPHDRPSLLPWVCHSESRIVLCRLITGEQNRRLRNLQGISVRNLNLTPPAARVRRKTITDDEVPYNLKTPTKLPRNIEKEGLQQSRSFSDLKAHGKERLGTPRKASTSFEQDGNTTVTRPDMGTRRRRSTLHWTGASPRMRQKKLEDVAANRMADVWFSIHCNGMTEPVYVSEVMENCMNPSFRFFDLSDLGPRVTRHDEMTLRLWTKTDKMAEYAELLNLMLSLRSLQYVGKSLENFHHPLPQNCVLFHFADGTYTSFTDMAVDGLMSSRHHSGLAKPGHNESTSSYDALMRLATLDECIQDALATRELLETQINSILHENKASLKSANALLWGKERLASARRASLAEKRQLRLLDRKVDELRESIRFRRSSIATGEKGQVSFQAGFQRTRKMIDEIGTALERNRRDSPGQIRRICGDLTLIFPIEPIKNKTLHFTIRGIYLPNSVFDDTNRDEIAAALGFTSQLVHVLSLYLSSPLPYAIQPNASLSTITDPISVALPQRTFPLYPTNVSYKFEYGVFLLNKDIEFLMNRNGLRMLDIRHTLPNVKYLMYVLTAGAGDLPVRRAGGVKGLDVGRVTPSVSRCGSDESVSSKDGLQARNAIDGQTRNASRFAQSAKRGKLVEVFSISHPGSSPTG